MYSTLKELYEQSVKRFAGKPSFSMHEREELTYDDFADRVETVQRLLVGAGLTGGDKVALLSGNMPNWGVCYFAVVSAGMVVVPILPDFTGAELDMIITHSESKALLVSDKLFSKVGKPVIEGLNVVIRTKNLAVISQRVSSPGKAVEPRSEDLAVIIYTSGTTSKPKGVMLTHYNLCMQMEMLHDLYPIDESDNFLSILPLSHTYECSLGMIYAFMSGTRVTYIDRPPTASTLLPVLREVRPTLMLVVPLIIEKLYKSQVLKLFTRNALLRWCYSKPFFARRLNRLAGKKLYKVFGGRLRFFGIGGAKLDLQTEKFLADAEFPYAIGYGLTETAPLLAGYVPSMKRHLQSTGPLLSLIKGRLDGVNPQSGEGELVVKSPSTMVGYYKNPEATREAFTEDGYFRTKDLGYIDRDGFLYIKGRANNMIVGPSGENIYPEEIESVINGLSIVTDSIVKYEEGKLVAMVQFNREELERKYQDFKDELGMRLEEIKKDIIKYVNSKVNKFSRISVVEEHDDDFEKTPTHKIKRYLYIKSGQPSREPKKKS